MEAVNPQEKKKFLQYAHLKQKELLRTQREYKEILSKRYKNREQTIIQKGLLRAIECLQQERDELRGKIWVAESLQHEQENNRYLNEIQCHIKCQESLFTDIENLKQMTQNVEREISREHRAIYLLNRNTIPESQQQAHAKVMQKKMAILENQLEIGIRQECSYSAINSKLREELFNILHDRSLFNDLYAKLVQSLNSDKKYMVDLIEHVVDTFDDCINVVERTDALTKKRNKEREEKKNEVQKLMRSVAANHTYEQFLSSKLRKRKLFPLQLKELNRRENLRHNHKRKIQLYNRELAKLLDLTGTYTAEEVIERYQQHESLYYSYFKFDNERGFHITLLNNSVNRLYNMVASLKRVNQERFSLQAEKMSELEIKLEKQQQRNEKLGRTRDAHEEHLTNLLTEVHSIYSLCRTDHTPLEELIGDHTRISNHNIKRFTKLLERRVIGVLVNVYISERNDINKGEEDFIVKDIQKTLETQTDLNDIVLTQQCPECAEGEAFDIDDTGGQSATVLSFEESKRVLFEIITQPEMQYRLHNISQCRLPNSRILAAKRNT